MFCRITWVVFNVLALGITLAKHGEARTCVWNFWHTLITFGIELALLIGGGFFD